MQCVFFFFKGIVCLSIVFFKMLRSLFFYLTYELVQIFITFNRTDVLNKLTSNYGKRIVLIFSYTLYKALRMSEGFFSHSFITVFLFFFVINAMNLFIHSLKRFVLKKAAYALLVFFNWVPFSFIVYANIPFKWLR